MEHVRALWYDIHVGIVNLKEIDREVSRIPGALLIDSTGISKAVMRSESAARSMNDKRSAVEGLALKECLARSKTRMRWPHSDVNVFDAWTKFDQQGIELIRTFLNRHTWSIV